MSKRLFYIISPFALAFGICLYFIITLDTAPPLGANRCAIGIVAFGFLGTILLFTDLILRLFIKDAFKRWLTEVILVLLFFIFISH